MSEEDRLFQRAMRKAEGRPLTMAEKRKGQRQQQMKQLELGSGDGLPKVDVNGYVEEDFGVIKEGDMIMSVSFKSREDRTEVLWSREKDPVTALEKAMASCPPIVLGFKTGGMAVAERLRKKKALEELMTLRAIKQDSQ